MGIILPFAATKLEMPLMIYYHHRLLHLRPLYCVYLLIDILVSKPLCWPLSKIAVDSPVCE